MADYYYAVTDENGVLCVDQLGDGTRKFSAEDLAGMADTYPESNYFWIEEPLAQPQVPPRPEPAIDADGHPTSPEGWESVVMATNTDTGEPEVIAGWITAGLFVQYAPTEAIVKVCIEAITTAYQADRYPDPLIAALIAATPRAWCHNHDRDDPPAASHLWRDGHHQTPTICPPVDCAQDQEHARG